MSVYRHNNYLNKTHIPKISVIIPVYNAEKYLQDCIDSLLNQSFSDFEMIFVNDASLDQSIEILKKNAKSDPSRIKVIDSEKNLCQGGARNLGIRSANGKYIKFVDSDDIVHPDLLKILYEKALETDADAIFCQLAGVIENAKLSTVIKENITALNQWNKKVFALDSIELGDSGRMDLMGYGVAGVCNALWRKNVITENQIFFPEHLKYEDNYWCSLLTCYISKVAFVPKVLYYYRTNPNSTLRSRNALHHLDRIIIEKRLLNEARRRKIFDKYYFAWEYIYTFRYAFNSYFLYKGAFDEPPMEQMQLLMKDLKLTFPKWENNKYYLELTPPDVKRKNKIISKFPKQYFTIQNTKVYFVLRFLKQKILRVCKRE